MSNVQFNLLPDVKMEHVKTLRTRNLIVSISVIASGAAIGLLVLLFLSVNVVQKKQIGDADKDIIRLTEELKDVPEIQDALTSQSQLKSLSGLHNSKHISSRLFSYLPQLTPSNLSINRVDLDFATNTLTVEGIASSQLAVNTFIDTLKFTNYKIGNEEGSGKKAFPKVTQSNFSISDDGATYGLTIEFDSNLFANNLLDADGKPQTPVLIVPNLTTTHASSDDPASVLFNEGGSE